MRVFKRKSTCHPLKGEFANRESYYRHAEERRIYQKVRAYQITKEEYLKMIKDSNGKCAICKLKVKELTVDHNHRTGKVRGVLCHKCNSAIGLFMENVKNLKSAIKYLYVYEKVN